ncbi:30S ribosomal protein S6e [Candidatus Woesearchaeota archaeon]|nr:MAG: 30S ribosomal protein S6e [Candidatus Woesearchaeota archaeon]
MAFKLNISDPETKRSKQLELTDDQSRPFVGRKIGMVVKGEVIDMTGYEFEITGGSDKAGFPMRKDLPGTARKKILAVKGTGIHRMTKRNKKKKIRKFRGIKQRKSVRGNTISSDTAQINVKIVKKGKQPLFEETQKEEKKKETEDEIVKEKNETKPKEE